jgi:hypothetical protein
MGRSMLKQFWRPETGIFLVIWLALMIGGRSQLLRDPGTFWHTKVGEQMLSTHQLVERDPFSCTRGGQPWVPHQWLGECVMALVHRIDGLDSLLLATVTLLACLYTWVAHRLLRAGLHWSLTVAVVVLTMAASSSHFHIRPHLLTIALMGLTCAWLCDFEAGRVPLRRLFWLVPLYTLWANIHGGMLGGVATLIPALSGWGVARLLGRQTPFRSPGQAAGFGFVIAGCALGALANPYGLRLPEMWLTILRTPQLSDIIQEHARLDPWRADGALVLLFGLVYLVALVGVWPRWPRITWLLPLPWLVLACTGIRHAPLFAITAVVALADLLPYTWWARWMARPGSDLFQFPTEEAVGTHARVNWRPGLLPAAVVLAALLVQVLRAPVPVLGHGWARLDPSYWPAETGDGGDEMFRALSGCQYTHAEGTPIFNELTYGGFLIYFTPNYRVFIDDRCELYGTASGPDREALLLEYDAAMRENPAQIDHWADQYGLRFALVRTGSPADEYLGRPGSGWRPVCEPTQAASFYRRVGPAGFCLSPLLSEVGWPSAGGTTAP